MNSQGKRGGPGECLWHRPWHTQPMGNPLWKERSFCKRLRVNQVMDTVTMVEALTTTETTTLMMRNSTSCSLPRHLPSSKRRRETRLYWERTRPTNGAAVV